jgi:hypothetical protein
MADMSKLEARIKMLEERREKGESVPELDALYQQMDEMNKKGFEEASKGLTGERPAAPPMPRPVRKAAGGTASSRADGCAQRGKTRGRMV